MPGYATDTYRNLKNLVQDLIDSKKIDDPQKTSSVKTNPLPKYQDIPRTKNKLLPNHSITPQPNTISFSSRESQASDGTPTS